MQALKPVVLRYHMGELKFHYGERLARGVGAHIVARRMGVIIVGDIVAIGLCGMPQFVTRSVKVHVIRALPSSMMLGTMNED